MRCPICMNDTEVKKEGYQLVVDHIMETFAAKKKARYPFSPQAGKTIKRLLAYYDVDQIRALWDCFLALDDDWTLKVGHKISEFDRQIPVLLDKSDWKSRCARYQGDRVAVSVSIKPLPARER